MKKLLLNFSVSEKKDNYLSLEVKLTSSKNTRKRLKTLQKKYENAKTDGNGLNLSEKVELKRLYVDIGIERAEILASDNLLRVFTGQFGVRMNNGKVYDEAMITNELGKL